MEGFENLSQEQRELCENYAKAKADALNKFTAIHRLAEQSCPGQIEIAYTARVDSSCCPRDAGCRRMRARC